MLRTCALLLLLRYKATICLPLDYHRVQQLHNAMHLLTCGDIMLGYCGDIVVTLCMTNWRSLYGNENWELQVCWDRVVS